ncbi:hypothetical protein QO009_000987 [Brevibacillus aydinogluensis]|nr:hypothetical protein [Brevibacillus aydinogluensis]
MTPFVAQKYRLYQEMMAKRNGEMWHDEIYH